MNLTSSEAGRWFRALLPIVAGLDGRDLFVLPPFTSIWVARDHLSGTGIAWGAQDVHPEDSGAHTGDVSAPMLADLGCQFVEIGHSERRRDHGETADLVAAKAAATLRWGMRPIVCVGERERLPFTRVVAGLRTDLDRILAGMHPGDVERIVIAYEPAWAIGEGAEAASAEHVGAVHRALAAWLAERSEGAGVPILYGGSVDAAASERLLAEPGVDGLFVGRFALDPQNFARIAWAGARPAAGSPA